MIQSCVFKGPPGLATPYLNDNCFQPPFQISRAEDKAPTLSQLNGNKHQYEFERKLTAGLLNNSFQTKCMFNQECADPTGYCSRGNCAVYNSNNPK
jgi:hypothetical protein